jgi:cyclohexa-1,5-dienecarbonyl-CoA hydratase
MSNEVRITRQGPRFTITMDRPPLNVVTIEMLRSVRDALVEADADPSVRVVRLEGAGRAFSAGVDVADHVGDRIEPMMDALTSLFETFERIDVPTVAVVHGAVLGGGLELALGCRLCVARDDAKLGQPEIRLGLFAPPASVLLPRLIGERRAFDLLLRGASIDAATALDWGLVQAVFPEEGFGDAVDAWGRCVPRAQALRQRPTGRSGRCTSTA